ncbi:MAG: SDR family oxidoreductase [Lachnospiraceae bacterium]|nr:SDR family oxidoreductase [Lachnospiraceae bacterium]MBP5254171.1 SDR family oxidoreductase [Lachnospiraceae bacterium]
MDRLKGKVAVITGGASGIGAAIADAFRKEGAEVVVFDLAAREDTVQVDVSDEAEVESAIRKTVERYGRIDILVNNAGFAGANKPTLDVTEEEWDRTFNVDVKGVLFCTKHVLPHMIRAGGGSIVNMSSIYAVIGTKGDLAAYHAAKGAVLAMTRQDAVTYGKYGIRVNAVLPGAIVTPLLQSLGSQVPGGWDAYYAYVAKRNPIGFLGSPEDVAYGVVYLASDEARFVTGTPLYIDGGYTAW